MNNRFEHYEAQRLAELEWLEEQLLFWQEYIREKEQKGETGLARRAREALARAEERKRRLEQHGRKNLCG